MNPLLGDAHAHVPSKAMQDEVHETIRDVFNAPDIEASEHRLKAAVHRYRQTAPDLSAWMDENLPEGLNVFAVPKPHRRMLRTSNLLENLNGKSRKRTQATPIVAGTLYISGWRHCVPRVLGDCELETSKNSKTGRRISEERLTSRAGVRDVGCRIWCRTVFRHSQWLSTAGAGSPLLGPILIILIQIPINSSSDQFRMDLFGRHRYRSPNSVHIDR